MKRFVIGLDAGGTKSHLALFDLEGRIIDFLTWGPLNHESLEGSFRQLEEELGTLLASALSQNGLRMEELFRGVFGMAGADTAKQHELISAILRRCGVAEPLVLNDAFLPIKAACRNGYGVCSINGTGCTAAGVDAKGRMLQVGGCGALTSDIGGGGQIGMSMIGVVYSSLYKGGPQTEMTRLLFDLLGVSREDEFLDTLTEAIENGSADVREFNRLVFQAAKMQDALAIEMLTTIGRDSGAAVCGIASRLDYPLDQPLDVAMAGSVFVKGDHPALTDGFKQMISERLAGREVRYTVLDKPPVAGAVIWALEDVLGHRAAMERVCLQWD